MFIARYSAALLQPAGQAPISTRRSAVALLLLAAGQACRADWQSAALSMPSVLWGVVTSILVLVVLRPRFGARMAAPCATAAAIAAWLLVVQGRALIPETSIAMTWAWLDALLVGIAVILLTHGGRGWWAMAALAGPLLLRSLHAAVAIGIDGVLPAATHDPNVAADLVIVGTLLLAASAIPVGQGAVGRPRTLGAVALALASLYVILGLLSARVGVLLLAGGLGALFWPTGRVAWRLAPLWVLAAAGLWLSLAAPVAPGADTSLGSAVDPGRQLDDRLGMIRAALEIASEHPVTGTGLHSFAYLFPALRGDAFSGKLGGTLVHNDWVQLLMEAGPPAPLLLLAVAVLGLLGWWSASALLRRGQDGPDIRLALACCVSLGVLLLHALVNFPLYDPGTAVLLVGLFACGVGAPYQARAAAGAWVADLGAGARRAVALAAALLGLALLWSLSRLVLVSLGTVVMGSAAPVPWLGTVQLEPERQFQLAGRLRGLAPGWSGGHYIQASLGAQTLRAQVAEAGAANPSLLAFTETAFERAQAANPWVSEYVIQHARMLREIGDDDLGRRLALLEGAQARNPRDVRVRQARVFHAQQAGRPELARALAREWLPDCTSSGYRNFHGTRALLAMVRELWAGSELPAEVEACELALEAMGAPLEPGV
ncbi:MAG TPA: O-antigen ligase family protein [Pseudomonadales bacterium]|nr:O-antigen ligase family protein [Pseudomonadales bacterium]